MHAAKPLPVFLHWAVSRRKYWRFSRGTRLSSIFLLSHDSWKQTANGCEWIGWFKILVKHGIFLNSGLMVVLSNSGTAILVGVAQLQAASHQHTLVPWTRMILTNVHNRAMRVIEENQFGWKFPSNNEFYGTWREYVNNSQWQCWRPSGLRCSQSRGAPVRSVTNSLVGKTCW